MIATYHNHSNWSDGSSPIADLVKRAGELGIDELGISDHFVVHPNGATVTWAMPNHRLADYVEEVQSHQDRIAPTVRLGLEVDWFPGFGDAIGAALEPFAFDYLIGSVHEVDGFPIDRSADDWNALSESDQNDRHRAYWTAIASMARSGLFDIAAHLDLPKKFGHRPTTDVSAEITAALDAIADAGMVVELNTAGWHRSCDSGYPSIGILRACRGRSIPVTLSADAHEPDHLVRDFTRGAKRLEEAGYEEVARFAARRRTFESLTAAVAGLS